TVTDSARSGRELDRRIREGNRKRAAWEFHALQKFACLDLWIIENLLQVENGASRNSRSFQLRDCLFRGACCQPGIHGFGDDSVLIRAANVVSQPRIGDEIVAAHQAGPAGKHLGSDRRTYDPAIARTEAIGRSRVKTGVALLAPLHTEYSAFRKHRLH